eukprot:TRINITY_DN5477_c0_g1_i1.p1 TRINITY_DN5477_c0_g1~~TRINITY_DN5477_c0_g1_i1.p1  ORF type:complete len:324 (-),score=43.59 TRINITY_DN5477_c0_g1_i1:142-1113(-)
MMPPLSCSSVWLLILLFYSSIFCCSCSVASNLKGIRDKTSTSVLFDTNWEEFEEYVIKGPRNYTVVVFFSSESTEMDCKACPTLKEQLLILGKWYNEVVPISERDLFFVIAEWKKNTKVFQTYHAKIQTMPSVIIIMPTTKKVSQLKFAEKDRISMQSDLSAPHIAEQINNKLKTKKIVPPEPSKLEQYGTIALSSFFLLFISYHFRKTERFWMCVALIFPWFTYTGTFFNLNTNPPFIHRNNNEPVIIYPSQQMQTVSEGLLIATLILIVGISFGILGSWVPNLPHSRKRVAFWFFIIVLSSLGYVFFQVWKIKSAWYLHYS